MVDKEEKDVKPTGSKEKDEFSDGSQETQTSWIYRLNKAELQAKLVELSVSFDDAATVDRLRKLLVKRAKYAIKKRRGAKSYNWSKWLQKPVTITITRMY